MTEDDIPDFVAAVLATGCQICAIGAIGYVFGDADLAPAEYDRVSNEIERVDRFYGERYHLLSRIIEYLHRIGRVVELPTSQYSNPDHGTYARCWAEYRGGKSAK